MPVWRYQDPIASAKSNYEASTLVNVHLLAALKVMKNFIPQIIRPSAVKSGPNSKSARRRRTTRVEINLKVQCDLRRTILRGKATGQWISVTPSTVNGTVLSAQEYRDAFLLRYGRCPGDLQPHCDGCGQKFSVRHAECKAEM
jgi:hypothetical protein